MTSLARVQMREFIEDHWLDTQETAHVIDHLLRRGQKITESDHVVMWCQATQAFQLTDVPASIAV